jgi:hypothetical protein
MADIIRRMAFGFFAAVISVLIFHQGMWALLHVLAVPGLTMPAPFPTGPIPPFGVPSIVNLCFWGGLWGALFAAVWRGPVASYWLGGLVLGFAAVLTSYFIVAALKGRPIGGGWVLTNWIRSLLLNESWGLGVGLIMMLVSRQAAVNEDARYR